MLAPCNMCPSRNVTGLLVLTWSRDAIKAGGRKLDLEFGTMVAWVNPTFVISIYIPWACAQAFHLFADLFLSHMNLTVTLLGSPRTSDCSMIPCSDRVLIQLLPHRPCAHVPMEATESPAAWFRQPMRPISRPVAATCLLEGGLFLLASEFQGGC